MRATSLLLLAIASLVTCDLSSLNVRVKRDDCVDVLRTVACQLIFSKSMFRNGLLTLSRTEGCPGASNPLSVSVGNIDPGQYAIYIGDKLSCFDDTENAVEIAQFTITNRIWGVLRVNSTLGSMSELPGKRVSLVRLPIPDNKEPQAFACGRFAVST